MAPSAPFETLLNGRAAHGLGGRWFGVYPALVSDIQDPDSSGRVKVTLPWSPDTAGQRYEVWARLATLMGGSKRGSWFLPDVNDEVLVVFEGGDTRRPYVIGGLWNGSDAPPESMDGSGRNYKKVLKSRNGVKVTLKDGPGSVEITDSNGNSIKLETSGVTISASATLTINASAVT
ncbi:MAG TPA: phage baseplate assembly protein V, partial [Vicinamibacterales bacterium]